MIWIVGSKPCIPGIAQIVISDFFNFKFSNLLNIFVFLFLNFFLILV